MNRRWWIFPIILIQLACIVVSALLWFEQLPLDRALAAVPLSAGMLLLATDTAILCAPARSRTRPRRERRARGTQPGRTPPRAAPPETESVEPPAPAAPPAAGGATEFLRPMGECPPATAPIHAQPEGLRITWQGGECVVSSFPAVVGRSAEQATIVLNVPGVSRRHARLDCEGDDVFLTDLGSKNGTFVNAAPTAERTRVQPGDSVRIGRLDITIERVGESS